MMEVSKTMLIKTEIDANSNKFWEAILHDDNRVFCRWGRVGATGQSKWFNGGQRYIDKKIAEKQKKGYKHARVSANAAATTSVVNNSSLVVAAKTQIKHSCPITAKLIDMLVKANIHQISTQSGGQLNVDIATGQIQLPSGMGVLTQDAITDARALIGQIDKIKSNTKRNTQAFKSKVQDYLMLVPQVVGRNKGWIDNIFVSDNDIEEQRDLLDSLEATLGSIQLTPTPQKVETIFDVDLKLESDSSTRTKIEKLYNKTRQRKHQSYSLDIKTIYSVRISTVAKAFEEHGSKIGNIQELWHGTKASNLLSILKSGLIIPRSASHGRMFGDGLYFSDQSTKALNYASGYWSGSSNNNCFMFLADVAMGKSYTPKSYSERLPKSGYDSTFAQANKSGVMNNEMIVYSTKQANLKYLVEFAR